MLNKLHTKTKDTQKLSSTLSHIPVQGMFESRSSVVQQKQQDSSQQPNLKTSLMQAERYGHHLDRMHPTGVSTTGVSTTAVQPKMGNEEPTNKHSNNLQFAKLGGVVQRALNPAEARLRLEEAQRSEWQKKFIDRQGSSQDMMAFANRGQQANQKRDQREQAANASMDDNPRFADAYKAQRENEFRNKWNERFVSTPGTTPAEMQKFANKHNQTEEQIAKFPKADDQTLGAAADMFTNAELETSAAEKPKKKTLWNKLKQKIPLLLPVGSVLNTAGQHTNIIHNVPQIIPPTDGAGVALPLTILGAGRSGRQAYRAQKRSKIASEYAENNTGPFPLNKDDHSLRQIAEYTAKKQGTRAKKLGFSSSLGTLSATAGVASLATGVVTPPGVAAGITSGVLGGISALPSVYGVGKALYKKLSGTRGKNRTEKATELYDLAKGGHESSIKLMQDIDILKRESRPNPEAKGYYTEDLQDKSNREKIIEYAKQKMRS